MTSKEEFTKWLNECPVDWEFTNAIDNQYDETEWYFFRIPKEEHEPTK